MQKMTLSVILILFSMTTCGQSPIHYLRKYRPTAVHQAIGHKVLNQIPEHASLSVQDPFLTHLAQREKLYSFPDIKDAEYILLDSRQRSYFLYEDDAYYKKVRELVNGDYSICYSNGAILLLKHEPLVFGKKEVLPESFLSECEPLF